MVIEIGKNLRYILTIVAVESARSQDTGRHGKMEGDDNGHESFIGV